MRDSLQVLCLGVLLLTMPPAFRSLAPTWYPALYGPSAHEHLATAQALRRKFWRAAFTVIGVVALVLLFQHLRKGGLSLAGDDWLRIAAAMLALTAALGRGGWAIQTFDGTTVERIDRGMYVIGQLGAAALLIFVLTL
jgi:hypothetical protein